MCFSKAYFEGSHFRLPSAFKLTSVEIYCQLMNWREGVLASVTGPRVGFILTCSLHWLFEKRETIHWGLLREQESYCAATLVVSASGLCCPARELEKGVRYVSHPGGPADFGGSWLADSCHLRSEPGGEKKGNQNASGYGLCVRVSDRLKAWTWGQASEGRQVRGSLSTGYKGQGALQGVDCCWQRWKEDDKSPSQSQQVGWGCTCETEEEGSPLSAESMNGPELNGTINKLCRCFINVRLPWQYSSVLPGSQWL